MSDMDLAITFTLGDDIEGGWANHPRDPGGKTMLGVTRRTLKRAIRLGVVSPYTEIRTLTVSDARKIYEAMYWRVVRGDELPRGLNALCFDVEVNSGRGGRILQKALRSAHGAGIAVDGAVGPQTLAAVKAMCGDPARPDKENLFRLMAEVDARRDRFWTTLGIFRTFGFGWLRRGSRVLIHATRMACGDL